MHHASCAYVIVLAGEFLQLTSNGRVPVCIHRVVVPPKLPAVVVADMADAARRRQ